MRYKITDCIKPVKKTRIYIKRQLPFKEIADYLSFTLDHPRPLSNSLRLQSRDPIPAVSMGWMNKYQYFMNLALQIVHSAFGILPHNINFIALLKPTTKMPPSRNKFCKNWPQAPKEIKRNKMMVSSSLKMQPRIPSAQHWLGTAGPRQGHCKPLMCPLATPLREAELRAGERRGGGGRPHSAESTLTVSGRSSLRRMGPTPRLQGLLRVIHCFG